MFPFYGIILGELILHCLISNLGLYKKGETNAYNKSVNEIFKDKT